MNVFKDNKDFYPTPISLIEKMVYKFTRHPKFVLEPEAGKGDIIKYIEDNHRCYDRNGDKKFNPSTSIRKIHAIENDPTLIKILEADKRLIVDSDFLTFSGQDKYDGIIMNPPFSTGAQHLLKAIDIMYDGEIVCLLNAETIKNPYTNTRKILVDKLNNLNADIEFLPMEFSGAERKTDVEVALIYINIKNDIKTILFDGVDDKADDIDIKIDDQGGEVAHRGSISELVNRYRKTVDAGVNTIIEFYKNTPLIGGYMQLDITDGETRYNSDSLQERIMRKVNEFVKTVRKDFWKTTLNLNEVQDRMTVKKREEFVMNLDMKSNMEFTENNVRTFIMNLMNSYGDIVTEAAETLFDELTRVHRYDERIHEKNRLHFDTWKTNEAFKVGKKVIVPVGGHGFVDSYSGRWSLDYRTAQHLDDIDKIMDYFTATTDTIQISTAIHEAMKTGDNSKIESTHFTFTFYKKGTIHLTFNSKDTMDAFNRCANMGKGWLPEGYGETSYEEMSEQDRSIIDSYEGKSKYTKFVKSGGKILANKNLMMIE